MSGGTPTVRLRQADTRHHLVDSCADDNAEHWRELHDWSDHEGTRLRDRIARMERERSQWENDTYAAAKTQAWDDALHNTEHFLYRAVTNDLNELVRQLDSLPATLRDADPIRSVARSLRDCLARFLVEEPGRPLAEVRRLRDAMRTQGERLHAEFGISDGRRCWCPGCEMSRAVEVSP